MSKEISIDEFIRNCRIDGYIPFVCSNCDRRYAVQRSFITPFVRCPCGKGRWLKVGDEI